MDEQQPQEVKITQDELNKINQEIEDKYANIAKQVAVSAVRTAEEEKNRLELSKLQEQLNKTQSELELTKKEYQEKMTAVTERLVQRKGVVDNTNPPVQNKNPNVVQVTKEQLKQEFMKKYGIN